MRSLLGPKIGGLHDHPGNPLRRQSLLANLSGDVDRTIDVGDALVRHIDDSVRAPLYRFRISAWHGHWPWHESQWSKYAHD